MSVYKLSDLFDIGVDILGSSRDETTNTILFQTGNVISEQVVGDRTESWQTVGLASRPSNPTKGVSACQGITIKRSDHDACIASRDTRGQAIYGSLEAGETCLYAGGTDGAAQGRILLKADGSVSIYTAQGNAAGGQSVIIQAAADGSISLSSQFGAIKIDSSGIKLATASGSGIQIDSNGVSLIGQSLALNGASVSLGANAIQPVIYGAAGIVGVASTSVKVAL